MTGQRSNRYTLPPQLTHSPGLMVIKKKVSSVSLWAGCFSEVARVFITTSREGGRARRTAINYRWYFIYSWFVGGHICSLLFVFLLHNRIQLFCCCWAAFLPLRFAILRRRCTCNQNEPELYALFEIWCPGCSSCFLFFSSFQKTHSSKPVWFRRMSNSDKGSEAPTASRAKPSNALLQLEVAVQHLC